MNNQKKKIQVKVNAKENGGELMAVTNLITHNKLKAKHQLNCIEMFRYIHQNFPQEHSYYSIAHEMGKSEREIQRMIQTINEFCPCIKGEIRSIDNKIHLYTVNELSEREFDRCFGDPHKAPLLYIFFKSFYIRKLTLTEIVEQVVTLTKRQTCKDPKKLLRAKRKAAIDMIQSILDATPLFDYDDDNGELVVGSPEKLGLTYDEDLVRAFIAALSQEGGKLCK